MIDELKEIQKSNTLFIWGKERRLRFGYRAWARLEERYGPINKVMEELKGKPFHMLPALLSAGIIAEKGEEPLSEEKIIDWLDEQGGVMGLTELLDKVKIAVTASLPTPDEVPTKAEKK